MEGGGKTGEPRAPTGDRGLCPPAGRRSGASAPLGGLALSGWRARLQGARDPQVTTSRARRAAARARGDKPTTSQPANQRTEIIGLCKLQNEEEKAD
uniref:Uncharacterized protein n=1 Tax=Setaria italica TaxID=4555 RepID=K3XNL5_SETIT